MKKHIVSLFRLLKVSLLSMGAFFIFIIPTAYAFPPTTAPIAIWQAWNVAQWERCINDVIPTGEDATWEGQRYIYREFDRLGQTNANIMMGGNYNQSYFIREYQDGSNPATLVLKSAAAMSPFIEGTEDDRTWRQDNTTNTNSVFDSYIKAYALDDNLSLNEGIEKLHTIVRDVQEEFEFDDGLAYFDLLNEGWGKGYNPRWSDARFTSLLTNVIEDIREREKNRDILITNGYQWLMGQTGDVLDYNKDVFAGELFPGWNIWIDNKYRYEYMDTYTAEHSYHGPYALRYNLHREFIWERRLSENIRNYGKTSGYQTIADGSSLKPEWWKKIQVFRSWNRDTTNDPFQFQYRRPTKFEYGMQAFAAIANGARGIAIGPYMSSRSDYPGVTWLVEGLISNDWLTTGDDPTPGARENFREPLSASTGEQDVCPPEELYNSVYPFDYTSAALGKAKELLEITRNLEWWWSTDGIDVSEVDAGGWYHASMSDADSTLGRQPFAPENTTTVGDRFHLRHILDEDEQGVYWNPSGIGTRLGTSSNIQVGLFDDPDGNPYMEYYLLVNLTCNRISGGNVYDATDNEQFTLDFLTGSEYVIKQVWKPSTDASTTILTPGTLTPTTSTTTSSTDIPIRLQPGSALLISVSPQVTTAPTYFNTGTTTLTGRQNFYSSVTIEENAELILDGEFNIDGNVYVQNGGKLTMTPGSSLLFVGASSNKILVQGAYQTREASLSLAGTAAEPIVIGSLGNVDNDDWYGIEIGNDCGTISMQHLIIRNAYYGVYAHGNTTSPGITISDSDIQNCYYGYRVNNSSFTVLRGSIQNCYRGFYASSNSYSMNGVYSIAGVTFLDNTYAAYGYNVYRLGIYGCTIQDTENRAVYAYSIDDLQMGPYGTIPTFVRHSATTQSSTSSAVYLSNSTSILFNKNRIVDNPVAGMRVYNSTISSTYWIRENLIANNGSKYPGNINCGQIAFSGTNTIDWGDEANDIFVSDLSKLTNGDAFLLSRPSGTTLSMGMTNIFWGVDTPLRSWVVDRCNPTAWANTELPSPLNPRSTSITSGTEYWGLGEIQSADVVTSRLAEAFALLDDEHDYAGARTMFLDLLFEGRIEALGGFCASERALGKASAETESVLESLPAYENDIVFHNTCRYKIANNYLAQRDFAGALESFSGILKSATSEVDSLYALIALQEALRSRFDASMEENSAIKNIELKAANQENLSLFEARIQKLEEEIAELTLASEENQSPGESTIPRQFKLGEGYPNPFNPSISIPFDLPKDGMVKVTLHNILGQKVATLIDASMKAGSHTVSWNATSNGEIPHASGVYLVRMEAGDFVSTRKIVMLK